MASTIRRWVVHSPPRAMAMLFLLVGFVKFMLDREWGYAVFLLAFIALGFYLNLRSLRREQARAEETPPDPAAPIHPE